MKNDENNVYWVCFSGPQSLSNLTHFFVCLWGISTVEGQGSNWTNGSNLFDSGLHYNRLRSRKYTAPEVDR